MRKSQKELFYTGSYLTLRLEGNWKLIRFVPALPAYPAQRSDAHITRVLEAELEQTMIPVSQPRALFSILYYLSRQTCVHISIRVIQTHITVTAC